MENTPHTTPTDIVPRAHRSQVAAAPSSAGRVPGGPPPVVLSARGLYYRYGSFEAVRGVDLTVHRGELLALLGTNGAGKTTTLEIFEGHRRPDRGEVQVLGLDPWTDRRRVAGRIGIVFQQSGLPSNLTPHEMLALWIRLTPDAVHHLDIADVLTRVELEHRAAVRIGQLSGGERRRLDLAVALINDPELIFLDEPTAGMDPEARVRTWQIIRDLLAEGVTVVLTTHYLEEAESLADQLAIMHQGQLAVAGSLSDIRSSQPSSIRAQLPTDAAPLPAVSGELRLDAAHRLIVETHRLQDDLTILLRWAHDHNIALTDLHATPASLAQLFHDVSRTDPDDAATHRVKGTTR